MESKVMMEAQEAQRSEFCSAAGLAKPLRLQQLENSLCLDPFLNYVEDVFNAPISGEESQTDTESEAGEGELHGLRGVYNNKDELRQDKMHLYNFSGVHSDRVWLQNLLLSESDEDLTPDTSDLSDEEERTVKDERRIRQMLRDHSLKIKYRKKFKSHPEYRQYQFYGSSLLSSADRYNEHNAAVSQEFAKVCSSSSSRGGGGGGGSKKRKEKDKDKAKEKPSKRIKKEIKDEDFPDGYDGESLLERIKEEESGFSPAPAPAKTPKSRKKSSANTSIEALNARRKKVWVLLVKKELGKVQRARSSNHKEVLTSCRRTAQLCLRVCRQKAMQSQKNMKETVWRMKRLTREMQAFWKKYDRVERDTRRRMEKEAEEQRKMDVEMMEAKRQQRKLNFLITQTELYAHFMQGKLASLSQQQPGGSGSQKPEELARILGQLDEGEKPARLKLIDDYDSESMKAKAQHNVKLALSQDKERVQMFPDLTCSTEIPAEQEQPKMFDGVLKHYQIKGVSWLANLYDQGINGILADEMGLGKTVQSIAFLCHIAEKYSIWGPFLVISPASTLHNWQQEFAKFTPQFKVIPYWGNPTERRILRQFWAHKNVHTEDASFHVVITSYQLVVADIKYFNRVKWQYLVLDEAQAIKSSSSVRWKSLLGFQCRNRLLLSGTPVQNSMAELWALLHFIMPTLFDSHDEFAEWFSKDIESHAENKGAIDERHLSRLHMILKPFMLRRIKKDVENELSDKIELMVYCPLTTRQKLLYSALKKKIRIEDLLHTSGSSNQASVTSSLMNLVMQFRKVCNHPELFERQEPKVPYHVRPLECEVPALLLEHCLCPEVNPLARRRPLYLLNAFSAENIYRSSLLSKQPYTAFSFTRFLDISPGELEDIHREGVEKLWRLAFPKYKDFSLRSPPLQLGSHEGLPDLMFTKSANLTVHGFGQVRLHSMPETLEHRILRSTKLEHKLQAANEIVVVAGAGPSSQSTASSSTGSTHQPIRMMIPAFKHVSQPTLVLECQPYELPKFLTYVGAKIDSQTRRLYCKNRRSENVLVSSRLEMKLALSHGMAAAASDSPHAPHLPWGCTPEKGGVDGACPLHGWSNILIPDKQTLISDAGKLSILDGLLNKLKSQGHRVLIYSQMTKMIDLLEEFMYFRKHTYMRLDGSSKISERRDMVADFQSREDIFVFLLSTRAGGLGINLTAADTVIFYDSDWNPTVDQQAMDRAHRLGQTKQVTVYRLICKDTIEERILQRAQEKSEIQRMVISGGNFKPDTLKPTEVVSLLLDDAEIEKKYRQKQAERRSVEERRLQQASAKQLQRNTMEEDSQSLPGSPSMGDIDIEDIDYCGGNLIVDIEGPSQPSTPGGTPLPHRPHHLPSSKILSAVRGLSPSQRSAMGRGRGRPRGSRGRGRGIPPKSPSLTLAQDVVIAGPSSPSSSSPRNSGGPKRGPGRPRLKPYGPSHTGSRSRSKSKKPKDGGTETASAGRSNASSPVDPGNNFHIYQEGFLP